MTRPTVLCFLALMATAIPAPATADIYRWEDPPGTLNFTDDLTNVPDAFRRSADMYQKEPPPGKPSARPSSSRSTYQPPPEQEEPEPLPDFVTKKKSSEATTGKSRGQKAKTDDSTESGMVPTGGGHHGSPAGSAKFEFDQLKAKIEAKEKLVASVEDRMNLAKNALRNRIIDPSEMELYKRYKAELPNDRIRLQELGTLLSN